MSATKTKRGFLDGYKTYDASDGYGSPNEWRKAFASTMGMDEARRRVASSDPYEILGVSRFASIAEIKKAYRIKAMECHPDRMIVNGMAKEEAEERFKRLQAAYTVVIDQR
jgi:DnaJ-class molecular chaperone